MNTYNIKKIKNKSILPPPVDTDVGGAREPRVQEVNTAHCARPPDRLL